jgi:hypothetical protein
MALKALLALFPVVLVMAAAVAGAVALALRMAG